MTQRLVGLLWCHRGRPLPYRPLGLGLSPKGYIRMESAGNLLATKSGDLVYLDFGVMSEAPQSALHNLFVVIAQGTCWPPSPGTWCTWTLA